MCHEDGKDQVQWAQQCTHACWQITQKAEHDVPMQIARVDQEHMYACAVYNNVHAPRPLSLRMFPRTGTTRLVTSNCHAPSGMQALQLPLSLSFHSCYKRARDFLTWSRCGLKLMHTHADINIPTTAFN